MARFRCRPPRNVQLCDNPHLARAAFEEAVRYESPLQTYFRTTTRAVEIGGVTKVLMFLGAANRDPRRRERPDDYDIERSIAGHVGFGYGHCNNTMRGPERLLVTLRTH